MDADGQPRHVLVAFFATDDRGDGLGVCLTDVTAQHRLRRAEAVVEALKRGRPTAILEFDENGRCVSATETWDEFHGPNADAAAGEGWLTAIVPADREAAKSACMDTIRTGEERRIQFRIARNGSPPAWIAGYISRLPDDDGGGPAAMMSALDVTEFRELQELSVRSQNIQDLLRTSEVIRDGDGLVRLLHNIAQRAAELTGSQFAALSTFDHEGKLERFIYTGISQELALRIGHLPVGRGLLGMLARTDGPVRLEDLRQHVEFTGWPAGHPEMAAFLGIPIRAAGRTIGSLYVTKPEGEPPFTDADEFAATMLASQVALGVSSAMAQERNGRVALLEERVRIAHDLHDGTIQSLYALGLEFATSQMLPDIPQELNELLSSAVERINGVIADIRQYIAMLEATTPSAAPDLARDLPYVIRQLVPPGIDTVVNITAPALQELSAREAEDLLFIARETLSNAVRHGQPTKIAVDLRQAADETALTIQDNGVGFDPALTQRGLGTATMASRADRLGAKLTVLSIPGMGTTVRVALPRYPDVPQDDFEIE